MKKEITELYQPADGLIEKVAGSLAAEWFEAALSSGLKDDRYNKNPRKFARENLERFIPYAIKHLLEILENPKVSTEQKFMIYEQILKRVTDPEMRALFPSNTETDKILNFELPDDFIEKNFPQLLDEKKVN